MQSLFKGRAGLSISIPSVHFQAFFAVSFFSGVLVSAATPASSPSLHLGTTAEQGAAAVWNQAHSKPSTLHFMSPLDGTPPPSNGVANWPVSRPFSETELTGFVALSGLDQFELPGLRDSVAKNLPSNASLILYVPDESSVAPLQALYGATLGDRLKFLLVPSGGDQIWARDSLPFPVHLSNPIASGGPLFGLVDSIYPQSFEPDAAFSSALSLPMTATQLYFRGGNLLLDDQDNCFAENTNEVAQLQDPQGFFKNYFGCATLTLLDQQGGIGDIDERIKFLGSGVALTDNDTYADLLRQKGYTVKMIPQVGIDMETYMNTLLVNGTIFVPQMGVAADSAALAAYTALGFSAIGVFTKTLADQGNGNIHCVSMNYPPGTFTDAPAPARTESSPQSAFVRFR